MKEGSQTSQILQSWNKLKKMVQLQTHVNFHRKQKNKERKKKRMTPRLELWAQMVEPQIRQFLPDPDT